MRWRLRTGQEHCEGGLRDTRNGTRRLLLMPFIQQITKSMKMIATTKLARAQRAMSDAKAYGDANKVVFKESEAADSEEGTDASKTLYVVVSSDRGLCGGIHSSVSKRAKAELVESSSSPVRCHSRLLQLWVFAHAKGRNGRSSSSETSRSSSSSGRCPRTWS